MKKLIIFLAGISISLASHSQSHSIPDSVIAKIADELVVKDHLQYVVNMQDSVLTIYKNQGDSMRVEIAKYKLNENDLKLALNSAKVEIQNKSDEIKQLKHIARKEKIIAFIKGFAIGVLTITIYVALHK